MRPSKEDLIAIARKHYPSSNTFLFTDERSPETQRLDAVWERWSADMSAWHALRDDLGRALPHHLIGETYPSMDGGPRCVIYMPQDSWSAQAPWDVVGCVSLLAPVYFVYGVLWDDSAGRRQNGRARFEPPPASMAWPAQILARTIEARFGFSALPREWAETPVPLYAGSLEPHETTLFHALFTSAPQSIP